MAEMKTRHAATIASSADMDQYGSLSHSGQLEE
jgi:hypothetical protein